MKLRVVQVDLDQQAMLQHSKLPVLFALIALICNVFPAFAGDRALVDVLGYSKDARYFAFEEFGIQDGSGFAYSNIYIVDLIADRWVIGTPIRMQAETEMRMLSDVRAQTHAQAQARLDDLEINRPAQTLALIGDGMMHDGKSLAFGIPVYGQEITGDYTLTIESFAADSGSPCLEWFADKGKGYTLSLLVDDEAFEIHRDDVLPRSRGCPVDYKIYAIYLPFEAYTADPGVALISVYSQGFEGPDRRFLAVPIATDR